jgi:acyl-CoA thioesterase-1
MKMASMLSGLILVVSIISPAVAKDEPAKKASANKKPSPSLQPIVDKPGLPRVLLIGDSISMGYTLEVREMLEGKANVHRIPTNGGPTIRGVENIDAWLGDGKWDVIHFNWGLHDIRVMPDTNKQQVSIADYEANLRKLVKRLKETGAKLIWCSTTPVVEGTPLRDPNDVLVYNAVAKKIMDENDIAIDDLYTCALPQLATIQIPVNVHFNESGSAILAKQVSESILKALRK